MPNHNALDDLALRSVRGDATAFNALVEALAPDVSRFVAARASSAAMVDEVVQAAFVTAFLRLADYEPGGNLGGWIKGIARNHLYEELRRQRRVLADDDLAERLIADDCLASGEEAERRQAEAARLHACLERLPESSRQLLECRYWHDEQLVDLARRLRQPANRLAARLYRIRQVLLGCLEGRA